MHCNARVSTTISAQQRDLEERAPAVVRRNIFHETQELPFFGMADFGSEVVQLLGDEGDVVGEGVVEKNFKCGMELQDVKLRPSEVAVCVMHVVDKNKWVGELVGDLLCDFLGKIVCWGCTLVQSIESSNFKTRIIERRRDSPFSPKNALVFDFYDEELYVSSSMVTPSSVDDTSTPEENSPGPQGSQESTANGRTMEAEFGRRKRRKYCMTNQKARVRNSRERGESGSQKVTLENVLCVLNSGACKQNCLHDINPKYILEQQAHGMGTKI